MMRARAALLLFTLPGLFAFSDTTPFLVWSSIKSSTFDAVAAKAGDLFGSPSATDEIFSSHLCQYQAVIMVSQRGLHTSDLQALGPSSYIATTLHSAPSSLFIPYMQSTSFEVSASTVAETCGSSFQKLDFEGTFDVKYDRSKHVFTIEVPEIHGAGPKRRASVQDIELRLSETLKGIALAFPSHVVMLSGTGMNKRGIYSSAYLTAPTLSRSAPVETFERHFTGTMSKNSKTTGIFKKYQLLTPGLITTLGIAFFVVFPVLYFVINALASIKSPLRSDGTKQHQAEKKNQ